MQTNVIHWYQICRACSLQKTAHQSPLSVAKYSFYTGFGTASILGGLSLVTVENLYIRADPVYKYCKNWVVKDDRVNWALGDGIRAGNLRSYRLDPGNFHFDGTSLIWRPPRIQMLFDVSATGMLKKFVLFSFLLDIMMCVTLVFCQFTKLWSLCITSIHFYRTTISYRSCHSRGHQEFRLPS